MDILGTGEQVGDRFAVHALDAVLQCLGTLGMVDGDTGVFLQAHDRLVDLVGSILQQGGDPQHIRRGFDLQHDHLTHSAICIIDHIVDRAGKGKDVFSVKRCDERPVELVDQDAAVFVRLLLLQGQLLGDLRRLRFKILDQQPDPFIGDGCLLLDQFMKDLFPLLEKTKHGTSIKYRNIYFENSYTACMQTFVILPLIYSQK